MLCSFFQNHETGKFPIIITKDTPAPYYNDDGVLVMSVYDFLLNEGSLDNLLMEKFFDGNNDE